MADLFRQAVVSPNFPVRGIYEDFLPPNLVLVLPAGPATINLQLLGTVFVQNNARPGFYEDFQPPNLLVNLLQVPAQQGPYMPVDLGVGLPYKAVYEDFFPPNLAFALQNLQTLTVYAIGDPRFELFIPPRQFKVSAAYVQVFDVKDPAEFVQLTFVMSPDLTAGEQLKPPVSVSVTVLEGADPNPTGILNGAPGLDPTATQIIQPVLGGVNGCQYQIVVTAATTNPFKTLTLVGLLPVKR